MPEWICPNCNFWVGLPENWGEKSVACPACDLVETRFEYLAQPPPQRSVPVAGGSTVESSEAAPDLPQQSPPAPGGVGDRVEEPLAALEVATILVRPQTQEPGERSWQRFANPNGNRSPSALNSGLVALCAGVIWLVVWLGFGMVYAATNSAGALTKALLMSLLVLVGSVPVYLFKLSKRLRMPMAQRSTEADARPPVLLLRGFDEDYLEVENTSPQKPISGFLVAARTISFEEMLFDLISPCGPVIAIGRPGEMVPPLGASRFWVSDDQWQEAVNELLDECSLVVLIMGKIQGGAGLAWEAQRLFGLRHPEKVVFVVPPVEEAEVHARWTAYRELSGGRLPAYAGGEIAATFDHEGRAAVARMKRAGWLTKTYRRTEAAYRGAIQTSPDQPLDPRTLRRVGDMVRIHCRFCRQTFLTSEAAVVAQQCDLCMKIDGLMNPRQ
jgi:hypothetical protein